MWINLYLLVDDLVLICESTKEHVIELKEWMEAFVCKGLMLTFGNPK